MSSPPVIFLPADNKPRGARHHALIFFVCGNPGLIAFYHDFLTHLSNLIRTSNTIQTAYDIYGRNLRGFNDADHDHPDISKPWDLEAQIESVYDDVASQRRRDTGDPYDFVIMIGHSVGAYITVEVFARHIAQGTHRAPHLTLRHGVLLFPTLTHIAESPSGRHMSRLDGKLPWLADQAHRLVSLILWPLTEGVLAWIMQTAMGFTAQAAQVAARWLKSRHGVRQAIYLGRTEMRTICEDRWEEELWEVSAADGGGGVPRFYMFYAREDHWVASHMRDEFVDRRKGRARIVIDEGDVPHAFCTRERKYIFSLSFFLYTRAWCPCSTDIFKLTSC